MGSNTLFFTLTTDMEHPGVRRLAASAVKWEVPLKVFRLQTKSTYQEVLNTKHLSILDALNTEGDGYTRFLFLDAWDTAFVAPVSTTVLTAEDLNFGAELNCYPDKKKKDLYDTINMPFPFLNSGVIWGPIDEYIRLCPLAPGHDQGKWTEVYLNNPGELWLDHYADVVLNLHSTKPDDLSRFQGGVRYNPTRSWPCIVHGNGKWPLPDFLGA